MSLTELQKIYNNIQYLNILIYQLIIFIILKLVQEQFKKDLQLSYNLQFR